MNIDDLDLAHVVDEFDEFLLAFCLKHKMPALLASAVVLSRLMHLNRKYGEIKDFSDLLKTISKGIDNKDYDIPEKLH